MSLQLQGAQRWISYGRASAGRKTFTCRSRVGRTSGRLTKRQSAPANAALQSRWLSLTHKHTCVHTTSDTETECRADLTLMHSYLCETSSYHLPPQGHGLWLIITIQRVWAQFLSRLRDYLPVGCVCTITLCFRSIRTTWIPSKNMWNWKKCFITGKISRGHGEMAVSPAVQQLMKWRSHLILATKPPTFANRSVTVHFLPLHGLKCSSYSG